MKWKMGALALVASLLMGGAGNAATVTVTPSSLNGWAFYSTDDSGALNTGSNTADIAAAAPAGGPLPPGAAHLKTASGAGNGSAQARLLGYAGTKLADLTSLSYDTYAAAWNGQQVTYVTIWLDNGDRLQFEGDYSGPSAGNGNPSPQQDAALGVWQHWDMLNGRWYSDNVPGPGSNAYSLSSYLATFPNVKIIDSGAGIGGIRVTSGFGSDTDNFETYFDNFKVGTSSGSTTYDFQGAAVVPLPPTVWMGITLMAGMVGFHAYKRHTLKAQLA